MKNLITESDIIKLNKKGLKVIPISENEILTPLALDKIKSLGLKIVKKELVKELIEEKNSDLFTNKTNKIAIGSDHTGFKLKNIIAKILSEKGFGVIDLGTYDENSCDYPDFAFAVSSKVKEKEVDFGVIIDATGNPSAITANKVPGIRAANCYNEFTAKSAKEHNNANILTLGAKSIGEETAKSILEAWLKSNFEGGRHQKRLNKIIGIEKQFSK